MPIVLWPALICSEVQAKRLDDSDIYPGVLGNKNSFIIAKSSRLRIPAARKVEKVTT